MSFIGALWTGYFSLPAPSPLGWLVWLVFLGVTAFSLYQWRALQPRWDEKQWAVFFGLILLTAITNLTVGIRLPAGSALPLPGLPIEPLSPALMLFSALAWMLAGGALGPLGAAILGALAGILRGAWDTHNLFSMIELAYLAGLFSVNIRQRYRTTTYGLLRQPLVAALLLIPLHTIVYLIGTFFTTSAVEVAVRLDYALSNVGAATLAFSGEVLFGGLILQLLVISFPAAWGRQTPLQPSPGEKSIETRFLFGTGTFITLLLLTLLVGDWIVAGRSAERMLRQRLASTAVTTSQGIPFFLETGQNLAIQFAADPRLHTGSDADMTETLAQQIRSRPFFDELTVLDISTREVLGSYPPDATSTFSLFPEEEAGLPFAANSVPIQIFTIPPAQRADGAARVSFVAGIIEAGGEVSRVLIGRTSLSTNPLTQPLINSLENMSESKGTGMLIDENGNILYHPDPQQVMTTPYDGQRGIESIFYSSPAPNGARQYIYYQPVEGRAWAVVLAIPASQVQQIAIEIALPLSGMIVVLAVIALASLRLGLRVVTGSLQTLANEANRIAQGKLDHPLVVEGVDEVGQLRHAFEQMRTSLQARLDELNRLLAVSQGVASSLEMQDAVKPVLEAALATGASSVRVVLSPSILPKTAIELPSRFSLGPAGEKYAYLDEQILSQVQMQDRLILSSLTRPRMFDLDPERQQPASLLAVALRHENRYYGAMWAAYDTARTFSEADARFVTTLAGQAALAAANAHLFLNVEASRRQLEAILNSTPDPVLVTDSQNRLLLANPVAGKVVGIDLGKSEGRPVDKVIQQKALADILQASADRQSAEIVLTSGRTYLATASSVMAEGRPVGRVCILRDVTHFKELDTMKSEFVATVSHDLRSPLTLMRGYATMLEMVGDLNEQQQGYVRKIISGVENMSRLVNNLLDLGRIEIGVGLQVENVNVRDIIDRVVGALQLQANQKSIVLSMEAAADLPITIQADQALLHQAVYNLVENAIKYTPNSGRVALRVNCTPNTSITFAVQDNGIGIAPADLPRLFEKFYRGKQREARAQHGTGLGLAIVRSIAERHGGKVWVESELGKGSTFLLQVPVEQPKEPRV